MRALVPLLLMAAATGGEAAATPPAAQPMSLGEAVADARRTAGVRRSSAALAQRDALTRRARADLIVDVDATAAYARRKDLQTGPAPARGNPYDDYDARLHASQPLLDLAAWRRLAAARGDRRAAEFDHAVAREAAAEGIAHAYGRLARAELVIAARDADRGLAEELARLATAQADAGIAERIVATRARTRLATAEGAAIEARQEHEEARLALVRALEQDMHREIAVATALDERFADIGLPEDGDAAARAALTARPELGAAEATVAAAEQRAGAAGAARWPRLDAIGDVGRTGYASDELQTTWSVGAALSVPLPLDGAIAADVDAARAQVTDARIVLEDARRSIDAEVRDASAALVGGRARLAIARSGLELAEQEVAQARARFEAGAADNLALVEAQLALGQARSEDIDARATIGDARIRLAHAMGRAADLR